LVRSQNADIKEKCLLEILGTNIFAPALGVRRPFSLLGLLQMEIEELPTDSAQLIIPACYLLKFRGSLCLHNARTLKRECKCLWATWPLGRLATCSRWKCAPGKTDPTETWLCQLPQTVKRKRKIGKISRRYWGPRVCIHILSAILFKVTAGLLLFQRLIWLKRPLAKFIFE